MKLQYIIRKHTSHVELQTDQRCCLGISVADIQKYRHRPVIKSIKNGSVAQKSHSLAEGDIILAIGEQDSQDMSKKDVKRLLKESGPLLEMQIEYFTREAWLSHSSSKPVGFNHCRISCYQRMFLTLQKEGESFGFVLRKNDFKRSGASEYPVISNIKQGGPADKEGSMMAGDKLLEIDNQSLSWLSLLEAATLLQVKDEAVFLIEYNVGIIDLSREKEVHIEIDCPNTNLGMTLAMEANSKMYIASILQGSLAQRCGAFHVGDEILAINGKEAKSLTALKANEILRRFRKNPGTITFIHRSEKLIQISERDDDSKVGASLCTPSTELESLSTAFASEIWAPPNSPSSSYHGPIRESTFFKCTNKSRDYDDSQLKTMSILRDINLSVSNLMLTLSEKSTTFNGGDIAIFQSIERVVSDNSPSVQNCDRSSQIVAQSKLVFNLTRELTTHVIKNTAQTEHQPHKYWSLTKFQEDIFDDSLDSCSFVLDLVESLNEMAIRRFVSGKSLEAAVISVSRMNPNCLDCSKNCYTALFAVRKVLLLLSLKHPSTQEVKMIRQVMDKVNELSTSCKDCRRLLDPTSHSCKVNDNQPILTANSNLAITNPCPSNIDGGLQNSTEQDSCYNQNHRHKHRHKVGLDMSRQAAMYKLTMMDSEESDEDCQDNNSTGKWDNFQQKSCFQRSNEDGTASPSIATSIKNDKRIAEARNVNNFRKNKIKAKSGLEFPKRNWKSAEVVSQIKNEIESPIPSVRPKSTIPKYDIPISHSSTQNHNCYNNNRNSFGFDVNHQQYKPISTANRFSDRNLIPKDFTDEARLRTHPETRDVKLKADSKGTFGFNFGYSYLSVDEKNHAPIITSIKPNSPAHKTGLLKEGDRILALNGFTTIGIPVHRLETLKREVFSKEDIVLRVEFDVHDVDVQWGTFTVHLEDSANLGFVMDEERNPSIVKGVVKGSVVHRCGQIFAKDQLLSLSLIREDNLDLRTWKKSKHKAYRLIVKRESNREHIEEDEDWASVDTLLNSIPIVHKGPHFKIRQTAVRTVEEPGGENHLALEHEFILFRDPITWDFGFLFGENLKTGRAYITGIRPGGPADSSNIIKRNDRIIKVNGTIVNGTTENSVMTLLLQSSDHVNLLTRRVLKCK